MNEYRKDFPILDQKIKDHPLIYLDNAATMQMPRPVMEAMAWQQNHCHSNVHRGIHTLSDISTAKMEEARANIARFIGAAKPEEVVFTYGTTSAINLVARSFTETFLAQGEAVLTTQMEHHSNYLPWREITPMKEASFVVCPITKEGDLDLEAFRKLLNEHTLLVAVTFVSNVTGAVNPVKEIVAAAHEAGAAVLVDAAQAMRHAKIDVRDLDCDFLAFSGHKIGGPTGTGILYGKMDFLEMMKPANYGGGMVKDVTDRITLFEEPPLKFEAGTPNLTGIVGLDAAVSYLDSIGMDRIAAMEDSLLQNIEEVLGQFDRIRILGRPKKRAGAISFTVDGLSSYDVAKLLDTQGIAVRSGHHCALPLVRAFGIDGAVRISPAFYNTEEEIGILEKTLKRIMAIGV